jgi:predicted nucleic acid-binding protein
MKVYVDTNIIMDFLLNRHKSDFFIQALQCKYFVIISNLTISELAYQRINPEKFLKWLEFAHKLEIVKISDFVKKEAYKYLINDEYNDAIHIASACEAQVEFIITRNIKDFQLAPIPVLHPDEL